MKYILDKIKKYNTVIIHGHTRPDGDSIGCQYGLMYLIKNSFPDKNVYVSGESSEYVSFIGKPDFIDDSLFDKSLSICVDTPLVDRLSDKRFIKSNYSIKIDHHIMVEKYCDYEYIDDSKSSCSEIIVDFFKEFKNELVMTKECANALLVGMLCDTGNFRHSNVTSNTFLNSSILMEYGANLGYINECLSNERIEVLKLKGYCLNNFKVTENGFAYILLDRKTIMEYNVSDEEAASLVSLISSIKDVPVWAMILETDKNIRVRLRSKGPSINFFANKYNGGGHAFASGVTLSNWNDVENFIKDADMLVADYKLTLQC